jgi:hypothetical protein
MRLYFLYVFSSPDRTFPAREEIIARPSETYFLCFLMFSSGHLSADTRAPYLDSTH